MPKPIKPINEVGKIAVLCQELSRRHLTDTFDLSAILESCDRWSEAILQHPTKDIAGAIFLSMWLKKKNLSQLIVKELGNEHMQGKSWFFENSQYRFFPAGIVGHWPASNVEILSIISLVCSLLGGNHALLRVPSALTVELQSLLNLLEQADPDHSLQDRFEVVSYPHTRTDIHEELARNVDGAMIWGGEDSVSANRKLPFKPTAQTAIFGPRISVAVIDKDAWQDPRSLSKLCTRLTREVWQFDQAACTSPQILFMEQSSSDDIAPFLVSLRNAFEHENRLHPREQIDPHKSYSILEARAEFARLNPDSKMLIPANPDWSIFVHPEVVLPRVVQGKTLHVVPVCDLGEVIALLDRDIQTIGTAISDPEKESDFALKAASRGVDRIVKLGLMHIFDSPWDGVEVIKCMMRKIKITSQAT